MDALFFYNYNQVYYNGSLMTRSDMAASDYNAPLVLTVNIQSSFFEDRLRVNWLNRWRDDSDGILYDERESAETPYGVVPVFGTSLSSQWLTENGEYVTAYKYGKIKGGLISDISVEYDVVKDEDYTFALTFDMYNIFNANVGVAAADPALSRADSEGRSYWIGFKATF